MIRSTVGRGRSDRASILLLTAGYVAVALGLVVVVVDASAVFLARRGLAATCDGAALAAAQSVDPARLYGQEAAGPVDRLPLAQVTSAVARYRQEIGTSGDAVLTATVQGGGTVRVDGARTVRLPVVAFLGIRPVTVRAHAAAAAVRRPD